MTLLDLEGMNFLSSHFDFSTSFHFRFLPLYSRSGLRLVCTSAAGRAGRAAGAAPRPHGQLRDPGARGLRPRGLLGRHLARRGLRLAGPPAGAPFNSETNIKIVESDEFCSNVEV